jgi:spore germination protein GerM
MRASAACALACVLLAACGVRSQDAPEQLPPDVLPSELQASAGPPTEQPTEPSPATSTTVRVYLVEGGRLVPVDRPARQQSLEDALSALLTAGEARGSQRSAVPPGTVVERLERRGDLLSVELSVQFGQVRGRDQVLAVAQVVWTATEFPPVQQVDLLVGGRRIELPVQQGEVSAGPAGRDDYRSVGPAQ